MFLDEVWAFREAYTQEYITVNKDGSNQYRLECCAHKYSKRPAQMFYRVIVEGKKGPTVFWEKEQGTINSEKHDTIILDRAQVYIETHIEKGYIQMQDNASCHRLKATQCNLRERGIIYIPQS